MLTLGWRSRQLLVKSLNSRPQCQANIIPLGNAKTAKKRNELIKYIVIARRKPTFKIMISKSAVKFWTTD